MKATDLIFVGVFESEKNSFEQAVQLAERTFSTRLGVYPALGLDVACQQLLFAVETTSMLSYGRARLADFFKKQGYDVKPFCMELFTPLSRDVFANSCMAELKIPSESSLTEAWILVNSLSEEVSEPNGKGLNFAVFRNEDVPESPFVAVMWSRKSTANLDYWQKWMAGKLRHNCSKVFFHKVFIHE